MSYFTQAGPTFRLHPDLPNFQPKLPVETFSVQWDGNGQIYLQLIENFKKAELRYWILFVGYLFELVKRYKFF